MRLSTAQGPRHSEAGGQVNATQRNRVWSLAIIGSGSPSVGRRTAPITGTRREQPTRPTSSFGAGRALPPTALTEHTCGSAFGTDPL